MDIEKKLLSLLDKPKCKQVFAFEGIQMEGVEYLQWAEEILLYSDDEEVNEAILEFRFNHWYLTNLATIRNIQQNII